MKKLLTVLLILLLFGQAQATQTLTEIDIGNSPSTGPEDAPITIIEFIDFQ